MIKRIFSLEQTFSLSKAASIIGVLTLVSRLAGLVRDRLFASHFGAGDILDAYYAAFRVPDFIFNLLILGTLSAAFIPVFTEWYAKDKQKANQIANTILNIAILAMGTICVFLLIFSSPLVHLLFHKFPDEKLAQTLTLTRIFLLSPIIFTASSIFGSILNSQKRFLVANLAPIFYNIGIIFGLLFLYPVFGMKGLGFGVIIGALLHLIIQAAEAMRLGYSWTGVFNFRDEAVRKIGKLFLPRIFGLDTSQISLLIGSIIGSFLTSGAIAILNLANNLQAVPLGIFAISIATAAFPLLSEQFAEGKNDEFARTLASTAGQILFFIIPLSILMLLFRAHIVRLVYGAGKFNWENTIATFNAFGIFSISLFAQALLPLFSRAFYARHNTKTPVIVGLLSLVLNISLSYFLAVHVYTFHVALGILSLTLQSGGVNGIAMGFSIASIINFLVLYTLLRHELKRDATFNPFDSAPLRSGQALSPFLSSKASAKEETFNLINDFDTTISSTVINILIASLVMGVVGYVGIQIFGIFVNTRTVLGLLTQSAAAGLLAVIAFFITATRLKLPQTEFVLSYMRRLVKR
jgi:putative peptidoglycan lipid II flippase